MRVINSVEEDMNIAIALGNFDGIHLAHRQIIKNCVDYAKNNNLKSCVLLFDIHTDSLLKKREIKLITTLEEKKIILKNLGIDFLLVREFNEETMKMSGEEFLDFLKCNLRVKAIFAGYDYTFGHKAMWGASFLEKFGKENDIYTDIVSEIDVDKKPVSSTDIRELIKNGDMISAKRQLGECYFLMGRVVFGKQNGTKMGIPTANISYDSNKLLPKDGVYKGNIQIDEKNYKCLINIGKNPTFNAKTRTVEVHIPDFSDVIYEKNIIVSFEKRIRDEIKFSKVLDLVERINEDLKILYEE